MDKIEVNRLYGEACNVVLHVASMELVSKEYSADSSARRAANRLQERLRGVGTHGPVIVDNTRKKR